MHCSGSAMATSSALVLLQARAAGPFFPVIAAPCVTG